MNNLLEGIRDIFDAKCNGEQIDCDWDDIATLFEHIDTIEADKVLFIKALQVIEWKNIYSWDINGVQTWLGCAWDCSGTPDTGHADDCVGKKALGIE